MKDGVTMPLFMRRVSTSEIRIMPHADTEVGKYELQVQIIEVNSTSVTPREYSFFVEVFV